MNIFRVFDIGLLFLGAGYRSRKNVMSGLVVKNNPQAIYSYENIFDIVIRNKLTAVKVLLYPRLIGVGHRFIRVVYCDVITQHNIPTDAGFTIQWLSLTDQNESM